MAVMNIAVGFVAEAEGKASTDSQWGNQEHVYIILQ